MKGFSVVQGGGTIIAVLEGMHRKDTVRTPAPWVCVGFALLCHGVTGCVQDAPPTATPKNDGYPGQWVRLEKAHVAKTWCYRSIPLSSGRGAVAAYERVRALAFHVRYQVTPGNDDLKPIQALGRLQEVPAATFIVYVNINKTLGYGLRTDIPLDQLTDKAPKELHCDGMVEFPLRERPDGRSFVGKNRGVVTAASGMARTVAQHFRGLLFPRAHALGFAGKRATAWLRDFLDQSTSVGEEMDIWLRSTPFEESRIIRSQAQYENENRKDYSETETDDAVAKAWFSEFLNTWNKLPDANKNSHVSLTDDIARMVMGTELLRRYMERRQAGALYLKYGFPVDLSLPGFFATLRTAELDVGDIRFQHFVKQLQARGRDDRDISALLKGFLCTIAPRVRTKSGEAPLLDKRLLDYYCHGKFTKNEEMLKRQPIDALKSPGGRHTPRTEIGPMFSLIINETAQKKTGYPKIKSHLVDNRGPRTVYIPDVTGTYGILGMSGWSAFDCQGGGNGLPTRQLALTVGQGKKEPDLWVLAQAKTTVDKDTSKPWETYVSVHDEVPGSTTTCPVDKSDYVLTHENDEALGEAVKFVTGLLGVEDKETEASAVVWALTAFHGRGISEWVDPISTMPEPDELPEKAPEWSKPELSISDVETYACSLTIAPSLPSGAERGVTVSLSDDSGWEQTWYASKDYYWLLDSTCANLEVEKTDRWCACWEASDPNQTVLKNGQNAESGFKPIRDRLLREMAVHYPGAIPRDHIDQIDEMFKKLWGPE